MSIVTEDFKINDFLTVKFEDGKTNIYVGKEYFSHCKYLLLHIPVNEQNLTDHIQSIDEAAENLNRTLEYYPNPHLIPPETEFWGHCSNLQAWAENEYDTRLLHRNIAFSLLKQLTQVGDPKAKKIFKEEIAYRFLKGNFLVREYLVFGGYLDYLNKEELVCVIEEYLKLLEMSYKKENKATEAEYNKLIFMSNRNRGYTRFDAKYYHFWSRLRSNYRNKRELKNVINGYMKAYLINPSDISIIEFLIVPYIRKGEYKLVDYFIKRKHLFLAINKSAMRDYKKHQKVKEKRNKFRKFKRRRYKPKKSPKIR